MTGPSPEATNGSDLGRHDPVLMCRACGGPIRWDERGSEASCPTCGARYPIWLGIVDLRAGRHEIAGGVLDAEEDLRRARDLDDELKATTYREWFFSGVERTFSRIAHPQRRRIAADYYRSERETYGIHGDATLAKLDDFLSEREPERHRRWRSAARTVLEAGCGTGQYELGFARRFVHVYVTDISYVSLVQARKIALDAGLRNVTFFASSIEALPVRSGSIDLFHCSGVIEHVADPERAIAESARVLSGDGIAFVLSPNRFSLYVEPHFRVVGFSFWPLPLRRALARRFRGTDTFEGLALRSLGEIRLWAARHYRRWHVYMLPRRLTGTARGGSLRTSIRYLLATPLLGRLVDLAINRLLLSVMPYHVVVAFKE